MRASLVERATHRANRLILVGAIIVPALLIFIRWGWPLFSAGLFRTPPYVVACYWLALGGYTLLLIRAVTRRGFSILVLLAFIWPAIDVLAAWAFAPLTNVRTDGLPSVAVAGLVCWGIWFFRPFAGPAERRRRAFWRYALLQALHQAKYRRRAARRLALPTLIFTATPIITPLIVWVVIRNLPSPGGLSTSVSFSEIASPMAILFAMAAYCLLIIVYLAADWIVRESTADGVEDKPCHRCGMDCREVSFDQRGWGRCSECGSAIHRGQWIAPPSLTFGRRSRRWRSMGIEYWLTMLAAGLLAALVFLALADVLYEHSIGALVIPALGLLVMASALRPLAVVPARAFDRQDIECRECGYDLRGTPTEQGIGACPECGTSFARMTPFPQSEEKEGKTTDDTEDTEGDRRESTR